MRYTPERVTSLEANEIFVFGSTNGGAHRGGAAKLAVEKFGAIMGQGEGLQGRSYAIPSMLKSINSVRLHVNKFLQFAAVNPQLSFLVTKIGCGHAGFKEEEIAPLFVEALKMPNISLPQSFVAIIGEPEEPAVVPTPEPTPALEVVAETTREPETSDQPETFVSSGDSGHLDTVVPKLEGPKVIGSIDLSKIPSRRKCYIIDTNVFIDCPDIISKISRSDKIVLSAKVVDELDAAKVRLDEEGKQNAARALRLINSLLKPRKIQMVCAEPSLLPDDFNKKSPDNLILSVALKLKSENPVMLTSDNGLQIKAKGLGIQTKSLRDFL